jgi:hypothetical protein
VIEQAGRPAFVVLPYDECMAKFSEPVEQGLIARIESSIDYMSRKTTLEKLAKAMRITLDQLLVE